MQIVSVVLVSADLVVCAVTGIDIVSGHREREFDVGSDSGDEESLELTPVESYGTASFPLARRESIDTSNFAAE
jgi:hypothetical protein